MTADILDARQRFTERQIRAICARLPWAQYLNGKVVIETDPAEPDNEPPPDAA